VTRDPQPVSRDASGSPRSADDDRPPASPSHSDGAPGTGYRTPEHRDRHTLPPDGRPIDEQPRWWRDFPIDWPQDHYVARRDFTKFMVLTSLAFVIGQFWIVVQNMLRRRRGKPPIAKVASLADLPRGAVTTFNYPGPHDPCVMIRTEDDQVLAYSQNCTHLDCAVIPRPGDGTIHCPCHAGYFDLATGRPLAGPPRRPLPRITLKVLGNDVYATAVEMRTT